MFIKNIIQHKGSDVISVEPNCSVRDVTRLLAERRIGAVLVKKGDKLVGVLSERDVVRGVAISGGEILDDSVESLMTKTIVTCTLNQHVNEILSLMTERRIRHLPVLEDGKLVGMISIGDLVHARINEVEQEADALKTYIASA
jgi:CBS domain-containing protein